MDLTHRTTLGRTGLAVSRVGIGSSYGVRGESLERAFHEHGVNLFYWGSVRRASFGEGIRRLAAAHRDRIVVMLQSYDRSGLLMKPMIERGLRKAGLEFADILLLGWHGKEPAPRILDAARALKERGRVRFLALSGHHRPLFGELARREDAPFDVLMFRYNAAHRGAESEILPLLSRSGRPGTIGYTATRWGTLVKAGLSAADCYRFVLARPEIDVCLLGPRLEREMEEGLSALPRGPLDADELDRARAIGDRVRLQGSRSSS